MRRRLKRLARTPVIQPKKSTPVGVAQAQEPKLATRKILEDSTDPEPGKNVKPKSPTFRFNANGSRVEKKGVVRPDTPPKLAGPASARSTYSETASSSDRKASDVTSKIDVGRYASLKDKTNRSKASPKCETKSFTSTSTHSQPAKPVVKPKNLAVDSATIAVDRKPVTAKRPRATGEAHVSDRPTKKPVTKQIPVPKTNVEGKLAAEANVYASFSSSPSSTGAEKTFAQSSTSNVNAKLDPIRTQEASTTLVITKVFPEVNINGTSPALESLNPITDSTTEPTDSNKRDEAAPPSNNDISSQKYKAPSETIASTNKNVAFDALTASKSTTTDEQNPSTTLSSKTLTVNHEPANSTPKSLKAPQQQKSVAMLIKKATKHRDAADDIINDSSNEEDVKMKSKTKKATRFPKEKSHRSKSADKSEDDNEDSTDAASKPRIMKKSKDITNSLTKNAGIEKPRSRKTNRKSANTGCRNSGEIDEKFEDDMSLAEENMKGGLVLSERRRRRTNFNAHSNSLTTPSSPRHSSSSSQMLTLTSPTTSTSPNTSDSSDTLDSAATSPSSTVTTPSSPSSVGTKRKHGGFTKCTQPLKKQKVVNQDRVIATAKVRIASLSHL